jgi:hypothetical protein
MLALAGTVSAQAERPNLPIPPISFVEEQRPHKAHPTPVRGLGLGKYKVVLEKTSLLSLPAPGAVPIAHRGDASESIYWTCFALNHRGVEAVLWLVAHGEMGGPDRRVTQFQLASVDVGAPGQEACPRLPQELSPLALPLTLRLGMTNQQVVGALGRPTHASPQDLDYLFVFRPPNLADRITPDTTTVSGILVRFSHGKAVAIAVSQATAD